MTYTIKLRRGSASDWSIVNPILSEGELGYELDTRYFKVGDGISAWNDLEYTVDEDQYVPDATGIPDGKILATFGEEWVVVDPPISPDELPDPVGQPDGKLLAIVSEAWVIADLSIVSGGLPTGGTAAQYLRKSSGTNYDAAWDTLTSGDVTDFTEAVQDVVGAAVADGSGIDAVYDDSGNLETLQKGAITINDQTGTAYTLVLADAAKWIRMNNAGAITLTVPPNSSVAFPIGTQIEGNQAGAGQITIAPGAGVTINSTPGLKVAAQYGVFGLLKVATDTWLAYGRLSA